MYSQFSLSVVVMFYQAAMNTKLVNIIILLLEEIQS